VSSLAKMVISNERGVGIRSGRAVIEHIKRFWSVFELLGIVGPMYPLVGGPLTCPEG
jgi:hypothetical protein